MGDIIKFGQSSRLFIINGPQDLMPEEGLTKTQKLQLRALEVSLTALLQRRLILLIRGREAIECQ